MKLIVGLGNPGARYAATRHNVGFMVIDRLVRDYGLDGPRNKFHSDAYQGTIGTESVLLLKPQTFMNRSGLAVGEAARFFKVGASEVLVIVDDIALPAGAIRLRPSGGAGGHNGLANIQQLLGTQKYPRLRIGVDEPMVNGRRVNQADYVLSPFSDEQLPEVEKAIEQAASSVGCWAKEGVELAMTRFNTPSTKPTKAKQKDVTEQTKETRSESSAKGDSQTTERTENP